MFFFNFHQPCASVSIHHGEPFDQEPHHYFLYDVQQHSDDQNYHTEKFNTIPSNNIANDTESDRIINSYDDEPYGNPRSENQDRSNDELLQHTLNSNDWNKDLGENDDDKYEGNWKYLQDTEPKLHMDHMDHILKYQKVHRIIDMEEEEEIRRNSDDYIMDVEPYHDFYMEEFMKPFNSNNEDIREKREIKDPYLSEDKDIFEWGYSDDNKEHEDKTYNIFNIYDRVEKEEDELPSAASPQLNNRINLENIENVDDEPHIQEMIVQEQQEYYEHMQHFNNEDFL